MDHLCYLCIVFLTLSRLVVTCWERTALLAPVVAVCCICVPFSCAILVSDVVLDCIVS